MNKRRNAIQASLCVKHRVRGDGKKKSIIDYNEKYSAEYQTETRLNERHKESRR